MPSATWDEWPGGYYGNAPGGPGGPHLKDPDPADFSSKWVDYNDWRRGGGRLYREFLRDQMKERGVTQENMYRTRAFSDVSRAQEQSRGAAREAVARNFGVNAPTGLLASLYAQQALSAPYGSVNLAAQEIGRRAAMESGAALIGTKQAQANWYTSLLGNIFRQRQLDLGVDQLDVQAELAGA